ncbi:MAG TPA: tetratricopeptide repeat protein [Oculatellaceae cyanobacterium]
MQPHDSVDQPVEEKSEFESDAFIQQVICNLYQLGMSWQGGGDLPSAEVVYRLILEITSLHPQIACPELILGCSNLADILAGQNRCVEAEHFYLEAIKMSVKVLGLQHPSTAIGLRNYAEFLRGIDLDNEADGVSNRAKEIFAQSFHRLVATLPATETDGNGDHGEQEQAEILLFGFDKQRLWRGRPNSARGYFVS